MDKVDMPNSVSSLNQTPIFEWCGSKNRYQKNTCFVKDWIACSNMMTNLDSIVNIIEGTYMKI